MFNINDIFKVNTIKFINYVRNPMICEIPLIILLKSTILLYGAGKLYKFLDKVQVVLHAF